MVVDIVAEVEDLANSLGHLIDIERLEGATLDALDVKLVIDLLLDEGTIGLQVNQQSFFGLFHLVHLSVLLLISS